MSKSEVPQALASQAGASSGPRFVMLGFVVLSLVTVVYAIDILPIIGPEVVRGINASAGVIDLGGTLLLAASGGFVMLMGQAGDRFSHKPIFLWAGCGLVIVGGLLATFPPEGAVLLLGRFIIGIGLVGMSVPCVAFLNIKFPVGDPYRGLAFGLFAAGFGFGFILAPMVGGLLGDVENGWRVASGLVPVLALICMVGIAVSVTKTRGVNPDLRMDVLGSVLLLLAMSGLIIAMNEASTYGWVTQTRQLAVGDWNWPLDVSMPFVLGILSIICWVLFAVHERKLNRSGRAAILDFKLFATKSFSIGLIACFLFFLGAFAAILVIPQFFLLALGVETLVLGLSLLPIGIGVVVCGYLAGPIGNKLGSRATVMVGFGALAVGSLLAIPAMGPASNGWVTAVPLLIFGIGFGLVYARISQSVLASVPAAKAGIGGATMFGVRLLAGAFGALILTLILTATAVDKSQQELSAQTSSLDPQQIATLSTLVDRGAALRQEAGGMNQLAGSQQSYQEVLHDQELQTAVEDIADAYSFGFRVVMFLVAVIALLGLLTTRRLPEPKSG